MSITTGSIRVLHGMGGRTAGLVVVMVAALLLLPSCSSVGRYTPDPAIAKGVAGDISYSGPLAIVNAQDSTEEHDVGFRGITVSYQEFTQSLVDALKAEFESNGATIQDAADKKLSVSVTTVSMTPTAATYRGAIRATVETADGHREKFYATRSSYASGWNVGTNPTKPFNTAFKDLVKSIVENEAISAYLAD